MERPQEIEMPVGTAEVTPPLTAVEVGGNPEEHFIEGPILDLTNSLRLPGKEVKVFQGGQIELHNMDEDKTKMLLGLDKDLDTAPNTGIRFSSVFEGRQISSEPNFYAKSPLPSESDSDQIVTGEINITFGTGENSRKTKYTVQVDAIRTDENTKAYTVTIIPEVGQEKDDYQTYYRALAKCIQGDSAK